MRPALAPAERQSAAPVARSVAAAAAPSTETDEAAHTHADLASLFSDIDSALQRQQNARDRMWTSSSGDGESPELAALDREYEERKSAAALRTSAAMRSAAENADCVVLEGWAEKESRFVGSWRRRWLVLAREQGVGATLLTYATARSEWTHGEPSPTESIRLAEAVAADLCPHGAGRSRPHAFRLTTRTRDFLFATATPEAAVRWLDTLAHELAAAAAGGPSVELNSLRLRNAELEAANRELEWRHGACRQLINGLSAENADLRREVDALRRARAQLEATADGGGEGEGSADGGGGETGTTPRLGPVSPMVLPEQRPGAPVDGGGAPVGAGLDGWAAGASTAEGEASSGAPRRRSALASAWRRSQGKSD